MGKILRWPGGVGGFMLGKMAQQSDETEGKGDSGLKRGTELGSRGLWSNSNLRRQPPKHHPLHPPVERGWSPLRTPGGQVSLKGQDSTVTAILLS
jgi:hypothetical protein